MSFLIWNQEKFKYPKAGEDNSIVSLFILDLKTKKSIQIEEGNKKFEYTNKYGAIEGKAPLCKQYLKNKEHA